MMHYAQRLAHWPIVLIQMRGVSVSDQVKLLVSACAAPIVSLKGLMQWQDPVLLFDVEVVVHDVGRFHLRHHTDDLWHVLPWRERGVVRAVREHLQPGDIFIDAGANIGFYTVLASRLVGKHGRVIAVEMMPDTAAVLRRHIALNSSAQVTMLEQALSDRAGQTITARVRKGQHGQASISHRVTDENVCEVAVASTTLSQVIDVFPRIALMKMDLEGAEAVALRGASDALARINVVLFEQWQGHHEVADLLRNAGFEVASVDGRNQIARQVLDV